jgi:serine/threonine protein kinase
MVQPPTPEPGLGSIVGRYRLERELGRGGFGVVYAATSTLDGSRVALKVLWRSVLEQSGGERRFEREAELARRLRHPNVVRVLDAGTDAGGLPYIAFELLEGRSLENEIERWGAMPPARAVRITIEVLAALEDAHAHGVIHRDLKPANVHLSHDGDRVKVLDFGIAKSTNPATLIGLTQAGVALGTPAYMAPEQLTGAAIGPATDLFAVGVVLIEMLMGRPLYGADASAIDILRARLADEPVPVPDLVRQLPIGAIVERAVHSRATDRFAHAGEMRAALAAALPSLTTAPSSIAPPDALPRTGVSPAVRTEASQAAFATGPHGGAMDTATSAPRPSPANAMHATPGYAARIAGSAPQAASWPAAVHGPPPSTPRKSGVAWIVGVFAVIACLVAAVAVVGGLSVMGLGRRGAGTSRSPSKQPAPTPAAGGGTSTPLPQSPGYGAEGGPVRTCVGAANLHRPALTAAVSALGWNATSELLFCDGAMINFSCVGPEGKGITIGKGDAQGRVMVMRGFGSSAEVDAYVAKWRGAGTSLGGGARAVLQVARPSADAARLLDRLCR